MILCHPYFCVFKSVRLINKLRLKLFQLIFIDLNIFQFSVKTKEKTTIKFCVSNFQHNQINLKVDETHVIQLYKIHNNKEE